MDKALKKKWNCSGKKRKKESWSTLYMRLPLQGVQRVTTPAVNLVLVPWKNLLEKVACDIRGTIPDKKMVIYAKLLDVIREAMNWEVAIQLLAKKYTEKRKNQNIMKMLKVLTACVKEIPHNSKDHITIGKVQSLQIGCSVTMNSQLQDGKQGNISTLGGGQKPLSSQPSYQGACFEETESSCKSASLGDHSALQSDKSIIKAFSKIGGIDATEMNVDVINIVENNDRYMSFDVVESDGDKVLIDDIDDGGSVMKNFSDNDGFINERNGLQCDLDAQSNFSERDVCPSFSFMSEKSPLKFEDWGEQEKCNADMYSDLLASRVLDIDVLHSGRKRKLTEVDTGMCSGFLDHDFLNEKDMLQFGGSQIAADTETNEYPSFLHEKVALKFGEERTEKSQDMYADLASSILDVYVKDVLQFGRKREVGEAKTGRSTSSSFSDNDFLKKKDALQFWGRRSVADTKTDECSSFLHEKFAESLGMERK